MDLRPTQHWRSSLTPGKLESQARAFHQVQHNARVGVQVSSKMGAESKILTIIEH